MGLFQIFQTIVSPFLLNYFTFANSADLTTLKPNTVMEAYNLALFVVNTMALISVFINKGRREDD